MPSTRATGEGIQKLLRLVPADACTFQEEALSQTFKQSLDVCSYATDHSLVHVFASVASQAKSQKNRSAYRTGEGQENLSLCILSPSLTLSEWWSRIAHRRLQTVRTMRLVAPGRFIVNVLDLQLSPVPTSLLVVGASRIFLEVACEAKP